MTPGFLLAFKIVDLLLMGVQMVPEVQASFTTLRAKLQVYVDEGRDPTAEEWAQINQEIAGLTAGIMSD